MAEYIKRESAIEALSRGEGCGNVCRLAIERILAADVAPVVHGRWVKRGCKLKCTNCKVIMSIDGTPKENLLNYCINCGAKMDGDSDAKAD